MPKPRLPASLTVGPYLYRVTLKAARDMRTKDGTDCLGLCNNDGLEISILRSLNRAKKREVLMHETLHACHYNAGRSPEETMTGEQWVEAAVHTLIQVMRENPEFCFYLIA